MHTFDKKGRRELVDLFLNGVFLTYTLASNAFLEAWNQCHLKDQPLPDKANVDLWHMPLPANSPFPAWWPPHALTSQQPVLGLCVCPSQATQKSPLGFALPLLPHHCQRSHRPKRCLITHTGLKRPPASSSFFFFIVSCPLCFNLSTSLAASCGFCTPNGFGWHLISCAFALAHLQVPIQALICQVTDDQWSCWLTCSVRVLPSGVRCTHYTWPHKHTSMRAGYR